VTLDLAFESLEAARSRLLSLGAAVEVLAPAALRDSLLDFATQIVALYATPLPA
jgi:predicted DNA-binding transcriptional regulator YafY